MIRSFLLLLMAAFPLVVISQSTPHMKFGKPLKEELDMEYYTSDSSTSAVVLVDYGESRIVYNPSQGWQVQFERYTRIKIFNQAGYGWADVAINLYESTNGKERISSLKGFTYNLENGQVQKTKLEKSSIFEEQTSENWRKHKFTMPNVKEGSVLEYTYSITSDFLFQFRDWSFQRVIPTAWSEYLAIIPEYFDYKQLSQGYVPITIKEQDISSGSLTYMAKGTRPSGNIRNPNSGTSRSAAKLEYINRRYRWAVDEVPAFKEEKFITSVGDHLAKIRFELSSIKYPGQPTEQIMDTWETLDRKLSSSDYFGNAIKKEGFIKDQVIALASTVENDLEKLNRIFLFVQDEMKWNGKNAVYVESTLKRAFDKREGNTADINLLLVSMLRRAGFVANPVILSTRKHGQINTYYPLLTSFNYVIAEVKLDGNTYLMDATDKFCPINTLPYRCLNNSGRRISENSGWVDLTSTSRTLDVTDYKLSLDEDGTLSGTLTESLKGHLAAGQRESIHKNGQESVAKQRIANKPGWSLHGYDFNRLEEVDQALISSYEISISEGAQSVGEFIYLDPILSQVLKENPFKLEDRQYPVDLGSPYKQTYTASITLPSGYTVDEIPKPIATKMPDGSAVFRYSIQLAGNEIRLASQIQFKKAVYNSEEYATLKEFFNVVVDKHNQQVVIRKI